MYILCFFGSVYEFIFAYFLRIDDNILISNFEN